MYSLRWTSFISAKILFDFVQRWLARDNTQNSDEHVSLLSHKKKKMCVRIAYTLCNLYYFLMELLISSASPQENTFVFRKVTAFLAK